MSNYPTTGPTTRFPPADRRDYDPQVEWLETGIVARQPETQASRDNTLIYILLAGALLLIYMSKAGAYAEWRAQPIAEPLPPAITIVDNSWNVCGICTDASPHFIVQQP